MIYADGSIYEGHWMKNERSGQGRLICFNGDFYLGEWKNDKFNGFGVYTW
jgi:hypothetical protein